MHNMLVFLPFCDPEMQRPAPLAPVLLANLQFVLLAAAVQPN
jgi:hypothetical protein